MAAVVFSLFLALTLVPTACTADAPIAANGLLYLDGSSWVATPSSNADNAISANVPGDLISDLYNAGVIASPWLDLTWREQAGLWDLDTWTYTTTFETPAGWDGSGGDEVLLVFDSVKMAADITLNGVALGAATSQFVRYDFNVGNVLAPASQGAANTLTVAFAPTVEDARNDQGRFMGCSGAWDWFVGPPVSRWINAPPR